jgi:kumamolisin
VAAVGDPATGYRVRVDGKDTVLGGTSAVAPLWSALICRLTQALGRPLGMINPMIYAAGHCFRDITEGGNGAYRATPGWDPCTGLGVPHGKALLEALHKATRP